MFLLVRSKVRGAVLVGVGDEAHSFAEKIGIPLKTIAVEVSPLIRVAKC